MQTSTTIIYKKINVKNLKFIYNLSILIKLYKHKHLIPISNQDCITRYRQSVNINLPKCNKDFGQKSIL